MAFYAFLGCDGSGKSAVISQVTSKLRATDIEVTCGHWRPVAFSDETTGSALLTADDPHGQTPRGQLGSIAKLGWLWLNWWVGWFRRLGKKHSTGVILFDRYHGDLLVDPKRYRYGGPMSLAGIASRCMPQPDRVFFLDADPDVLLSRKQEVGRETLELSRQRYLELTKSHPRFRVVDASQPLDDVVHDVMTEIGTEFSNRPPVLLKSGHD